MNCKYTFVLNHFCDAYLVSRFHALFSKLYKFVNPTYITVMLLAKFLFKKKKKKYKIILAKTWLTRFVEKTFGLVSVILYKGDFIMESLINCDFLDEASIFCFVTTLAWIHGRGFNGRLQSTDFTEDIVYSATTFIFFVNFSHFWYLFLICTRHKPTN